MTMEDYNMINCSFSAGHFLINRSLKYRYDYADAKSIIEQEFILQERKVFSLRSWIIRRLEEEGDARREKGRGKMCRLEKGGRARSL